MGVPPSGKRFEAIDIVRIEGGKAAERWGVTDVDEPDAAGRSDSGRNPRLAGLDGR
jgi:hypothetical protein